MIEGPNESGSFRRQIPPENRITLSFEKFSSFVEEYRAGVSLGGVFIKTDRPRPVGTEIHFEFKLADGFRLLHGQGSVVWVRPKRISPELPAGMGARFTAVDESGRQLVLKLLEEQVKAGGAPFEVDKVPEGATDSPEVDLEPEPDEEPTLLGASVQDIDPNLPSPEAAVPRQAELGFDAPWGKELPGVPDELLGGESDPEVDKAVNTIRPSVPAAAGGSDPGPAPQPYAEAAAGPSVPPVSSNLASTPVAPPIEPESDGGSAPEDPTVIGRAVSPPPQEELPLPLGELPEVDFDPPPAAAAPTPTPAPAPAPSISDSPPSPEVSLEDSMIEAANEIEAGMGTMEESPSFDPAPEEISFELEADAPAPDPEGITTFDLPSFDDDSAAPAPSAAGFPAEPTAEMPAFDPVSESSSPAPGPDFEADFEADFEVEPTVEMPSFDPLGESSAPAPAADFGANFEVEPTAEMPSFDPPGESSPPAPATDFAMEPTAEIPSFDPTVGDGPASPGFAASEPYAEMPSIQAGPVSETAVIDESPASSIDSFDDPAAYDDFLGEAPAPPAATHPQDFADEGFAEPATAGTGIPLTASTLEASEAWEEEEDFVPPARRGVKKHLVAIGLLALLVVGIYFFRGTLVSLVGLGGGGETTVATANLGPPPGPVERPLEEASPQTAQEVVADSDTPIPVVEVQAEPEGDGEEILPEAAGTRAAALPQPRPAADSEPAPPARAPTRQAIAPGGGGGLTAIDWSSAAEGTRVVLRFAGPVSENRYAHDALSWAAEREMLTLYGVENFPQNEIAVGTPQLRRIRLGAHPGEELRLVFDLGSDAAAIRDLRVVGSRLEVLVQ